MAPAAAGRGFNKFHLGFFIFIATILYQALSFDIPTRYDYPCEKLISDREALLRKYELQDGVIYRKRLYCEFGSFRPLDRCPEYEECLRRPGHICNNAIGEKSIRCAERLSCRCQKCQGCTSELECHEDNCPNYENALRRLMNALKFKRYQAEWM